MHNRDLSADLSCDSRTVLNPPEQLNRRHHRCQQTGNWQMESEVQYCQQTDGIVASPLCMQRFHCKTLDRHEIVFVVLNSVFVVLQLGFAGMYLRCKEKSHKNEERKKEHQFKVYTIFFFNGCIV